MYKRQVYGYVRDEEVAKDIVHDTFLTFWNNRKRLDLSYSAKSYLFTLAQNYALNYLRHLRVVEVLSLIHILSFFNSENGTGNRISILTSGFHVFKCDFLKIYRV